MNAKVLEQSPVQPTLALLGLIQSTSEWQYGSCMASVWLTVGKKGKMWASFKFHDNAVYFIQWAVKSYWEDKNKLAEFELNVMNLNYVQKS